MSRSYAEQSRINWEPSAGRVPDVDELKLGTLQRIATATERMSQSWAALERDRDYHKRMHEMYRAKAESLTRSKAALRGTITRLKKQAQP